MSVEQIQVSVTNREDGAVVVDVIHTSDAAIAELRRREAEERAFGRALVVQERRMDPTLWGHLHWYNYINEEGFLEQGLMEADRREHQAAAHRERVLACRRRGEPQ